jgi:hypothetical protein
MVEDIARVQENLEPGTKRKRRADPHGDAERRPVDP